ncbi:MAG: hypothetical protein WBA42_20460 [Mesorhizobium sp.]
MRAVVAFSPVFQQIFRCFLALPGKIVLMGGSRFRIGRASEAAWRGPKNRSKIRERRRLFRGGIGKGQPAESLGGIYSTNTFTLAARPAASMTVSVE